MYAPVFLELKAINYLTDALIGKIQGQITRKDERIIQSDEDVTVSTLSLTDGEPQFGTVNVTIYLKDVTERGTDAVYYKPNTGKFDYITDLIMTGLGGNYGKYGQWGNLWVSGYSPIYPEEKTKEHFRTVTVNFKLKQLLSDSPGIS